MLYALSAGQKTGLGLMGAAFIAFALASSFWIPRARPDFPGRGVKLFVLACVLLTAGMLSTVIALAKESKEEGEHRAAPEATQPSVSQPPAAPSAAPPPAAAPGSAGSGKALFGANGCGSCHTYGPAGSKGTVGPDLDKLAADAQKAGQPLPDYVHESIADPNAYVVPGFPKGVMPQFKLSSAQLDDLTAFLTQK